MAEFLGHRRRVNAIVVSSFAGPECTIWGYDAARDEALDAQAAALVAQLADPDRGWDAIVIGEYERAFYGARYAAMAPLFEHYGIQLWMPEAGGRRTGTGWVIRGRTRTRPTRRGAGGRTASSPIR